MAPPLLSIETRMRATPSRHGEAHPRTIIDPRLLAASSDGTRPELMLAGLMASTTVKIDDGRGLPPPTEILVLSAGFQIPMRGTIRARSSSQPIEPPAHLEEVDLAAEVFGRPRKKMCLSAKAQ